MSTNSSLYWRIGLLLAFIGIVPWVALRLRRIAFFNNDFRDDAAMFAGHEPGTRMIEALHVFRNTLPSTLSVGQACAPAGDTDGDGHADLFVCAAADDGSGGGTVALRSGATGEVLHRWLLPDKDYGPYDMQALGDRDGDGTHELLLVQGPVHGYGGRTLAYVVDGSSGRILHDLFDEEDFFPPTESRIWQVGDLDDDGLSDLCVQDARGTRVVSAFDGSLLQKPRNGMVRGVGRLGQHVDAAEGSSVGEYPVLRGNLEWALVDGGNGVFVRVVTLEEPWHAQDPPPAPPAATTLHVPAPVPALERAPITWVGDADGDGVDDIALGSPRTEPGGEVFIQSAVGGTIVRSRVDTPGAMHGQALLAWGDDALLVGAPGEGLVRLVSIADGAILRTLRGETPAGGFGLILTNAGDVDGDGVDDLIVEEPGASSGAGVPAGDAWRGTVWVLSGADLR